MWNFLDFLIIKTLTRMTDWMITIGYAKEMWKSVGSTKINNKTGWLYFCIFLLIV